MKKIKLNDIAPVEFFDKKSTFLKSFIAANKLKFTHTRIELKNPFIFLCNKSSKFDKHLISMCLKGNVVFLKDDVIQKLYSNKLSKESRTKLLESFKKLKENNFSVVIFPEKKLTIFGSTSHISMPITEFIFDTTYNIKFLYLIGTFFSNPVWSENYNNCSSKLLCQFSISHISLAEINDIDRNDKINSRMPSSASVYAVNDQIDMRSNKRAQNLETVVYACPHCKELFSMYSEFNCLKCKNCGTAIEISRDAQINLSKNISTFDDLPEFLFDTLTHKMFSIDSIIKYENLKLLKSTEKTCSLEIFSDKIVLTTNSFTKTYQLENIVDFELYHKNILHIELSDEDFYIQGKNKENFYILFDLLKINKN